MSRLIVYGDIHGSIDEFKELREKIGIQDGDIEYAIGDLLDRGKDSRLRHFLSINPRI